MTQSLYSAVSGIQANQSALDVVSNNIANLQTVGFKSSSVNFQNIFSKTLSSGSAPSGSLGGTNPMQIGLGTGIAAISTNFGAGSVQSTGKDTDLMINGNGFFTLANPNGSMYLTRAGNFTVDSSGALVNPNGLKALGTSSVSGGSGSTTPIHIPTSMDITRNTAAGATTTTNILNPSGTTVTEGTFTMACGATNATINTTGTDLNGIMTQINTAFGAGTATLTGGKLTLTNNNAANALTVTPGTSNFTSAVFGSTIPSTGIAASGGTAVSSALTDNGNISIGTATNTTNTATLTSTSISSSGAIIATYSTGDKLTVSGSPTRSLELNTSTGGTLTTSGGALTVTGSVIQPSDLQLQLSNIANPNGLISQGGNNYTVGPDAGTQSFGAAGASGMGTLTSGVLESSNVDLTTQFANMVLAQTGISAASRAFSTENQILQQLVQLGR